MIHVLGDQCDFALKSYRLHNVPTKFHPPCHGMLSQNFIRACNDPKQSIVQISAYVVKLDNPYSITFLVKTRISKWYMIWCGSKNGQQRNTCFTRNRIACSNYNNPSTFNSQDIWGDLHDHLMSTRIFTLKTNKISIWAPKIMNRKVATSTI